MKRNSLLELFRFLFALVILYYHNCFIIQSYDGFYSGRFVVIFFFLVSGFFISDKLKKCNNAYLTNKTEWLHYLTYRLKRLGIPLLIAYSFSVADTIVSNSYSSGFLHYLWFIHVMLIAELLSYILYKYIKRKYIIDIIYGLLMILGISLRLVPSIIEVTEPLCLIYFPFGYFMSKVRFNYKNNLLWLTLIVFSVIGLSYCLFSPYKMYKEFIMGFILFPILLYSILQVELNEVKLFNYIGSLSFEIYVYQSIARFFGAFGINNNIYNFLIVASSVLLTEICKFIFDISARKKKKELIINIKKEPYPLSR
ncbi:MAG TPA: acyltransferase family protein [Haloplasmataceae bacterium]